MAAMLDRTTPGNEVGSQCILSQYQRENLKILTRGGASPCVMSFKYRSTRPNYPPLQKKALPSFTIEKLSTYFSSMSISGLYRSVFGTVVIVVDTVVTVVDFGTVVD